MLRLLTQVVIYMVQPVVYVVQLMTRCQHVGIQAQEGKCFCPDCGQGVVFQWVVLRCQQCQAKRPSQYVYGHILPTEPCCVHCGHRDVVEESLENARYYQLTHAQLVRLDEQDYQTQRDWTQTVSAWVQQPNSPVQPVYLLAKT